MATQAFPFGEWDPDVPGGLQVANNVRAIEGGYAPVKGPQAVTAPMPTPYNGGGAFVDSTGASTLIAAGTGAIYKYNGSWSIEFGITSNQLCRFAQFGDNVLVARGSLQVVACNLITSTNTLPTNGPSLIDIAQCRDFVMGITTDNALQWCQFNNTADWTRGVNQADKQPSLWGQLRRIVGGEYMLALTDRAIIRGTYVGIEGGLDIIWQFDQISAEVGCMAPGSVCNIGRLVFFLSERGFEMCDGNQVIPIADEKFNRWFFSNFSRSDIANIAGAIDPRNSCVLWAMPGSPGVVICYNWVLKRATTFTTNVQGMFTGYTAGTNLDALDALYPSGLDSIPVSLDDPSLEGGNPVLLVVDNNNVLNALTGPTLDVTLRVENIEPTPGRRSRVRQIRLETDAPTASATLDARLNLGDAPNVISASAMRLNGKMPVRTNGRFNHLQVDIPAGTNWNFVNGFELEWEPGDER